MAFCLSCCKYTAFFGIIFYISMGFIVLLQTQYLRFTPNNKTDTVISCFLTALLEVGIIVGIMYWEYRQRNAGISQPEYLKFDEERSRARQSSFKGIAMVDLKTGVRKDETQQHEQKLEEEEEKHEEPLL